MAISPTTNIPMARIQLVHFAEGVHEHYLCVEGYVQSYEENIIIMSKNTPERAISLFMIMMIKSREKISQTHKRTTS